MRRSGHIAAVAVLTGLVSGCGVVDDLRTSGFAKQDGAEIVTAASKAMAEVTSMRVTGQTRIDGNPLFVDLTLGKGTCTGTVRFNKSRVALRRVGDRAWFKGDEALYGRLSGGRVADGALTRLSTTWVRADDLADEGFCDLGAHLASFTLDPPAKGGKKADSREWTDLGDLAVGEEVELDGGGRAVEVASTPTDTAWIASEAPHHVVRLESSARDGGYLSYTEFNHEVVVEAP